MAFTDEQTWKFLVNFQYGSNQADNRKAPPDSSYCRALPTLMAEDSGEIVLYCYEYWNSTTDNKQIDFGATATVKLYIKLKDSTDAALELATGAVGLNGSTEYSKVTVSWAKDALTSFYANNRCILYIEIIDAGSVDQRTWYHYIDVVDPIGDEDATSTDTSTTPISTSSITGDTTLTAYPGKQVVFVDASSNTVDVTLPSASAYTQQEILIVPIDNTFEITVTATINGDASGATSAAGEMNALHLFSDGSDWYNFNHVTVIR